MLTLAEVSAVCSSRKTRSKRGNLAKSVTVPTAPPGYRQRVCPRSVATPPAPHVSPLPEQPFLGRKQPLPRSPHAYAHGDCRDNAYRFSGTAWARSVPGRSVTDYFGGECQDSRRAV